MSKVKGPTWWKMYGQSLDVLCKFACHQSIGLALAAASEYFNNSGALSEGTEYEINEDAEAAAVFAIFKAAVDESLADYRASVEAGSKGGNKAWEKVRNKNKAQEE